MGEVIVDWFNENGRVFPWRETDNPFKILISEILLQKTTAKQVADVYEKFFEKFPNPKSVAKTDIEKIEEIIGELGLAKRAKFINKTAEDIVKDYSGKVPRKKEELDSLLGVGKYTRNAVLCFAFGKSVPIVDANVSRVLRRYFGLSGSKPAYRDKKLWRIASRVLPKNKARNFNLGLLDLAAKVCLSEKPLCTNCPLNDNCTYRKSQEKAK